LSGGIFVRLAAHFDECCLNPRDIVEKPLGMAAMKLGPGAARTLAGASEVSARGICHVVEIRATAQRSHVARLICGPDSMTPGGAKIKNFVVAPS
jgi:hypothetical protein